MDADARERALETKVAELEERLSRLEQAAAAIATNQATASTSWVAPPPPPPTPATTTGEPEWLRATRERAAHAASTYERATEAGLHPAITATDQGAGAAPVRAAPRVAFSLADLEARLTGRALAWVGGLALVLGAIFFLSLAFSRGWIGPEARVIIGLAAGALSLGIGAVFMDRGNRLLGHVLTPVGLAVISISLVGATRLFGLIPVELGLLLALASSIAAAAIAIRANSPIVAAFGLIAVLAAPPLLGAPADFATLAFVAVVLIGTTAVALWRSWPWLPTVAFLLAVPQVAVWINGAPEPFIGVTAVSLFWLVNLIAAAGEEVRRHRDDLSASSATLMLANATFLLWAGFTLLDGDLVMYRGPFLVLISIAHLAVGLAFVRRDGDADLFGLLTIGTGLAALAMAAPVQFGAPAIPIAWTAEAAALAWVAARRGHPYSALVAGVLFGLAGAYLVGSIGQSAELDGIATMTSGQAGSLAFFIGGTAVGLWFLRDLGLRAAAAAYAILVVSLCASIGIGGVPLAIALTAVLVVAAACPAIFELLPDEPIAWQTVRLIPTDLRSTPWRPVAARALTAATVFAGLLSTAAVIRLYGPSFDVVAGGIPFVDAAGGALAIYLAGLAGVAALHHERHRESIAALGLLVIAWASARVLDGVDLVVGWSVLFVAGLALWRGLRTLAKTPRRVLDRSFGIAWTSDKVLPGAALIVAGLAALHLMIFELPIWELGNVTLPAVPFSDAGTIGALSLAAAALIAGVIVNTTWALRASMIAVSAIVAYVAPFEVASWAVVVVWAGLAIHSTILTRWDATGLHLYVVVALVLESMAAALVLDAVAPPSRLVVGPGAVDGAMALQSLAALGAVTIGLVAVARVGRSERWARWIALIAGVSFVYLASVALVDVVAMQAGGSVPIEELRTWGQVGLSILWAILGVLAFVGGLQLRRPELRQAGLALLGLATLKVFLFDLSALDVAYRVISLIALGLLLLASAGLWQRNQPRRHTPTPAGPTPTTDDSST
jgi:uncharacterized membrane protein